MLSLIVGSLFAAVAAVNAQQQYLLGLGIGDITGPIVETNMMGYASLDQSDNGVHMRMRARAFIVATADTTASTDRILFLNLDIGMGDSGIRRGILAALQSAYNGTYTRENVAIVATHSHAGVGGYVENLLPQITSLGFVRQTYDAIIAGTMVAVRKAHGSLAPGTLGIGTTDILDGNINRSPYSYLQNPASERARYSHDTDKEFTLLDFKDPSGRSRGFMSFYPVHGTSLYINQTWVSVDNKGYAAYLYENHVEPDAAPGNTTYVAGFVQANVGDTTPNVLGAFCEAPGKPYHGQPCDFATSTCGNRTQECHGRGPGFRDDAYGFSSNAIIGDRQYQAARRITDDGDTQVPVSGPVRSIHQWVNMDNYTFTLPSGATAKSCPGALGYSFAAGTTDGPGAFDFIQGNNGTNQNPIWEIVKAFVTPIPSAQQVQCHAPKPILFNVGFANTPYRWTSHVVDTQTLRIGNLVILIVPAEFTTMSGRRIREAVRAKMIADGLIGEDAVVVLAGPANTYAHYCATFEEYQAQRYEGASTLFGPHTLAAYTDIYTKHTPWLSANPPAPAQPADSPAPDDETDNAISLQTGVVMDGTPIGKNFGDVVTQPASTPYTSGQRVTVRFHGANPRNNLRLERTYLSVERETSTGWVQYRTDSHPSTLFTWIRTNGPLSATSEVEITWTIEAGTPVGKYRIAYFGDWRPLIGSITPFEGRTNVFTVA